MMAMGFRRFILFVLGSPLVFFFLVGCNRPGEHLAEFNRHFQCADYAGSVSFAESRVSKSKNPKAEDLLWSLQIGAVERLRGNYERSTEYFDRCEDMLRFYDLQPKIADGIVSTAASDNLIPYRGQQYDGVMVNTYKGLNFMSAGRLDLARVEFNRVLDRQRRAKEKFNLEISELKSSLDRKKEGDFSKKNIENPKIRELIEKKYPNLNNFQAYPDFVNPFATYMAGLYFGLVGDYTRSVDLLKETYGMVGGNHYLAEDLAAIERTLDGQPNIINTVWVIFENGIGPYKTEYRIDIPLFVASDQIKYFGIALPMLKYRHLAESYLDVRAGDKTYRTLPVADMDRVVHTEFSKDYDQILARAIVSATAKAAAQYALEKGNSTQNSILSVLMPLYSAISTAADVRMWTSLPKNFQVARFEIPESNKLSIQFADGTPLDIDIPRCDNALVYIKKTGRFSGADLVDVIVFNEKKVVQRQS